jgi:hypothetical protein
MLALPHNPLSFFSLGLNIFLRISVLVPSLTVTAGRAMAVNGRLPTAVTLVRSQVK